MELEEFMGSPSTKYAILSHTWEEGEVTMEELTRPKDDIVARKQVNAKIEHTCQLARKSGIKYVWIDTCCIDKTSSAELTEAINSMFKWYARAEVCYAYFSDLAPIEHTRTDRFKFVSELGACRWFTRGWTLQELIAPGNLEFYDRNWYFRGTKSNLCHELSDITGINIKVLKDNSSLSNMPAAHKMSWAARRQTTRVEDMAYCLLGIFGVNMPLVYGEGPKAFIRLQEEISKETNDLSLLAWRAETPGQKFRGAFANSPAEFRDSCFVQLNEDPWFSKEFAITNKGLRIHTDLGLGPDGTNIISLNCHKQSPNSEEFEQIGVYLKNQGAGVFTRARAGEFATWDLRRGYDTSEETIYIPKYIEAARSDDLEQRHREAFMLADGFDGLWKYFAPPAIEPQSHWDPDRQLLYAERTSLFTGSAFFQPSPSREANGVIPESGLIVVFGNSAKRQRPWLTIAARTGPDSDVYGWKNDPMKLSQVARTRKTRSLLLKDKQGRDLLTISAELEHDIIDGEPVFSIKLKHQCLINIESIGHMG